MLDKSSNKQHQNQSWRNTTEMHTQKNLPPNFCKLSVVPAVDSSCMTRSKDHSLMRRTSSGLSVDCQAQWCAMWNNMRWTWGEKPTITVHDSVGQVRSNWLRLFNYRALQMLIDAVLFFFLSIAVAISLVIPQDSFLIRLNSKLTN